MVAAKRSPAKANVTTKLTTKPADGGGDASRASASEQSQGDAGDAESGGDDDNDDEEDEGNDGDDDDNEGDNDELAENAADDAEDDDDEELDAVGFGDAMSKILGQSVAADAQPILAKRTTARMREIQAEKQGAKSARLSAAEKREKEQKDMVVPDHSTAVLDRRLRSIATKGVVALFNAIEKHQHQSGSKADEKSDKKVKEMSKDNFLGLLKASQKSVGEKATAPKSAWSVVQDDYMMGAKLKDWDAAHGTEKGRVRVDDDAEAEAAEDAAWKQVGDLDSDDDAAAPTPAASKRKSAKSSKPAAKKKTKRS